MAEHSEKVESDFFKNKWHELGNTCLNTTTIKEILSHLIIPYIARYGLKKLLKRTPDNCVCCRNKVMYGINIDDARKSSIAYDISYIHVRDKDSLIWPSKLIVILSGMIIKLFEQFIQSENFMNDYYESCSFSYVALLALKNVVYNMISSSLFFNAFQGKCRSCGIDMVNKLINPLTCTFFNVTTNNFTMLLNRRELARKITMKLVKEQKKKNRYVNKEKGKNDCSDVSTWICDFCKNFLKSYGAIH